MPRKSSNVIQKCSPPRTKGSNNYRGTELLFVRKLEPQKICPILLVICNSKKMEKGKGREVTQNFQRLGSEDENSEKIPPAFNNRRRKPHFNF